MAVEQAIARPKERAGPALKRAAGRFRAWWDGDDPTAMLEELAGMADRVTGAEGQAAVPMSARLKAWWDGSDPESPPASPGHVATALPTRLEAARAIPAASAAAKGPVLKLPPEKLEIWTKLWGAGFCEPFDKSYAADLVKPFALNEKMTVVDLGARLGGGTRAVSERYKVWITGMDPDPEYAAAGMQFSVKAGLKSRAPVIAYDIDKMALPPQRYNCLYAMETFHRAKDKRKLLTNVAQCLTDQGQLVFTDFVLRKPNETSPTLDAWRRAEPFATHPWSAPEMTKYLGELRLETRIDEDMSDKYRRLALLGWQNCLDRLAGKRPPRTTLIQMLNDAELWVMRLRALNSGALQVRRYFALMRR